MKRSTDHILTTHTGSLPRPLDLVDMVLRKEAKRPVDEDVLAMRVRSAVAEAVQRQAEVGVTVLNDGEQGKPGYSTYMKDRLTGFEGESTAAALPGEAKDFPEYTARRAGRAAPKRPACTGPIAWQDRNAVLKDIENLQAAVKEVEAEEVFMTAASPGVVPHFMKDQYYGSEEKYLYALADALKEEYDAIHRAGFVLQVDCPDLCMSRHNRFSDLSTKEFKKIAELPELVAQRIVRYAEVVGRENVIAGTDCGFGTFVRAEPTIDPRVAWAKLKSLAEGAAIASKELWN